MKKQAPITLKGKTRDEKKVIIAQDVINNINTKKYIAGRGSYIGSIKIEGKMGTVYSDELEPEPVKENWDKLEQCNVCAVGACLMSITKFNNKLNYNELPGDEDGFEDKHIKLLKGIFTGRELAIIEAMFEGVYEDRTTNIGRGKMGAKIEQSKAYGYAKRYNNLYSEDVMIAIMQSIVDNKGKVI